MEWGAHAGGSRDRSRAAPVGARLRLVALALAAGAALVVGAGCESSSSTAPPESLTLIRVGGNGQTGTVGTSLPGPVVVRVTDEEGRAVSGVRVSFAVVAGGGSASTQTETTGADGTASAQWTVGTVAGAPQLLRASLVEGGSTVDFSADAVAGSPSRLAIVAGDGQLGQRTGPLPAPLVVQVSDGFDNPVPGALVTFGSGEGGSFEPAEAETDDAGVATSRWSLGAALGEQTATASVNGVPPVSFSATSLEQPWIRQTVTSLSAGETAVFKPVLEPPPDDPAFPPVTVTGGELIIPGGGGLYSLASDRPFSVIYVFVGDREGHYTLEMDGAPVDSADVVLTLADTLVDPTYQLRFAVGEGNGAGALSAHVVEVHEVPTGPLQVSVSWDVPSDVDLYLVEPSGETIYFDNPASASGGTLNLDANGGCIGEDLRNESITWLEDVPPTGTYVVRVNLWSSCQQEGTRWVVTIRMDGQPPRMVQGEFTEEGDGGDVTSGEVVATFTF